MTPQPAPSSVPRHPIAVVSERTGLSQDVLRVWERRYAAVSPARKGGQRLYSDDDVTRLSLLHAAVRAGRSVGQVARLATEAIRALVAEDMAAREASRSLPAGVAPRDDGGIAADEVIARALELARGLHVDALNALLRRSAARSGVSAFLESVAAPLLRRVGDEWHAGRLTPAQEHLVSSTVHDIAAESLRGFTPAPGAPRMLVATLTGDRHAIGAALVGATAAMEGWSVVYLGADLPGNEIAGAAEASGAALVAVSIVFVEDRARLLGELARLRERLPASVALLVGGTGARELTGDLAAVGVGVETSLPGLVAELRRLTA